jgi:glycerol-3-phosphate dehydrogenase
VTSSDAQSDFDLAIIGGGINGCGIARDAAGRGARVVLFEQQDLAGGTSSASTKLIHGGLRYLEYGRFGLVREALREREVLWALAPHIIRPLRFVMPHQQGLRPAWMLRLGLFLYDHLGARRRLPGTRALDLRRDEAGQCLKPELTRAFEYSDCRVDDARLVVLNAQSASEKGAQILTRTKVVSARPESGRWLISAESAAGEPRRLSARVLVNAAGPWVSRVLHGIPDFGIPDNLRMVKGSHIVTKRLFLHDRAYIFQNADRRIVFAIPYEQDFTLIGTTDLDYAGDPAAAQIDESEIDYLCRAASDYFLKPVQRQDIVWSYAGIRLLYDDGASAAQQAARDYVLHLHAATGAPPLLSVLGGKITTYRRLSETSMDKLAPYLEAARAPAWTAHEPLPGGDFSLDGCETLAGSFAREYAALPQTLIGRLVRAYGTRAARILDGVRDMKGLGRLFGADLTRREVDYLVREEWARTADDVLWRRSKLGLRLDAAQKSDLADYMDRVATGV